MNEQVYQIITDRIIDKLEQGEIPWRKPWISVQEGAFNRISGRTYSVLNQLLVTHGPGEYATAQQWRMLGGEISEEEKKHPDVICFWKMQEQTTGNEQGKSESAEKVDSTEKDETEKNDRDTGAQKKRIRPVLRYYRVYHISQVQNVDPLKPAQEYVHRPMEEAEDIITTYVDREKIHFENQGISNSAWYSPVADKVHVPGMKQFFRPEEYYSTVFHELIHSTGNAKRLNRLRMGQNNHFGSEAYSKEELVAEIGAAVLQNYTGIETKESFTNSAAYIQSWLQVLQKDQKLIVITAAQAEKAVKWILNESIK